MLAVIPARGGSKGVPHKNIRNLLDKPLIAYTIEAALESKVFTDVIVSTDDYEIAEVAVKYNAKIPFFRPSDISEDKSSSDDAIFHAIRFFEEHGTHYEYVCKLQPTSPLRNCNHIREAYRMMLIKNASFVVSVCECEHSPLWSRQLGEDNSLDNFIQPEIKLSCRQKLPVYYRLNGAIYMAKTENFLNEHCFFGKNGFAYIMKQEESVDIDSLLDFKIAETILKGGKAL